MYLAELRARTEPIRLGVVGIGRMGRGVADQVATMPGMRVMAAADVDLARAEACLRENGADPLVTDELGPAQDALRRGRPVATADRVWCRSWTWTRWWRRRGYPKLERWWRLMPSRTAATS